MYDGLSVSECMGLYARCKAKISVYGVLNVICYITGSLCLITCWLRDVKWLSVVALVMFLMGLLVNYIRSKWISKAEGYVNQANELVKHERQAEIGL